MKQFGRFLSISFLFVTIIFGSALGAKNKWVTIDPTKIDEQIESTEVQDGFWSPLFKKIETYKKYGSDCYDYMSYYFLDKTRSLIPAGICGMLAGGYWLLKGGSFKWARRVSAGVTLAAYLGSRYFSEPLSVTYYRQAHNEYRKDLELSKVFFTQPTLDDIVTSTVSKYQTSWPLVDMLVFCRSLQARFKKAFALLEESERINTILRCDDHLREKRITLKSLIEDALSKINSIISEVLGNKSYKNQYEIYQQRSVIQK